jgi:hypothetical protein
MSSLLIYLAIALAFLVAILELDTHRGELASMSLPSNHCSVDPVFMSP